MNPSTNQSTWAAWLLAAALMLLALPSFAQVPPPGDAPLFTDGDRAARVYFPRLDLARNRARLDRYLARHPDDSRAWSAHAYAAALAGDSETALADLARADGVIDLDPGRERELLWSEGWIRLHLGQIPEARDAWTRAVQMHGGHPYWAPYSFAVLAELGGERHTAIAWYDLAARSLPARWDNRRGMLAYTRWWRPEEREAISAVFEAWYEDKRVER